MKEQVRLTFDDPLVVSQAPAHITGWGYWQFPIMEKSSEGIIHLSFHINIDSAIAYGSAKAHYLSYDNGSSWKQVMGFDGFGHVVGNGDTVAAHESSAVAVEKLDLPEPVATMPDFYNKGSFWHLYRYSELPEAVQGCYIKRKKVNTTKFKAEKIMINPDDTLAMDKSSVIPIKFFWRLRKFPGNVLCAPSYFWREKNGIPYEKHSAQFIVSDDNGHTWNIAGEVNYKECICDEHPDIRTGYSEPDITRLPDGGYFCLLRTTIGQKFGPLMWSKSSDNMKTWSEAAYFDKLGVWPELLTLDNGVTLASYGRPGVYLRATSDPAGLGWDDPVEIVEPIYDEPQRNTCSYTAMIPIGDSSFLLAYSKFDEPGKEGNKRKSIIIRKVHTQIIE